MKNVIVITGASSGIGKEFAELLDKKRVLAITKCDLIDKDLEEEMLPSLPKDLPHVFISSVSQEGLKELKDILWEALKD